MNGFTKAELEDIYEAVMDTNIAMFENLPSKIQSMIDNYKEECKTWRDANHIEACPDCGRWHDE